MLFVDWDGIGQRIKRNHWWLESLHEQVKKLEGVQLGYTGPVMLRRDLTLRGNSLFWHKQVMGNTGSGKTELLKQLIREFIKKDIPFCLIDPHSDLAESVLSYQLDSGYFAPYTDKKPANYQTRSSKNWSTLTLGSKTVRTAHRTFSRSIFFVSHIPQGTWPRTSLR